MSKVSPEQRAELREVLSAGVISWTDRLGEPLASTIFSVLDDLEAAEAKNRSLLTDLNFHQMHWPFKMNERVQFSKTSEYYEDYRGAEIYFAGAHLGENGDIDVWTKSPGEGFTDGWSMDDLEKWTDIDRE